MLVWGALVAVFAAAGCGPAPGGTEAPAGDTERHTTPLPVARVSDLCAEPPLRLVVEGTDGPAATVITGCVGRTAQGTGFAHEIVYEGDEGPAEDFFVFVRRSGAARAFEHRIAGEPRTPSPPRTVLYRAADEGLVRTLYGDRALVAPRADDGTVPWVLPRHAVALRSLMIRLGIGRRPDDPRRGTLLTFSPETGEVLQVPYEVHDRGATLEVRTPTARLLYDAGPPGTGWAAARLRAVEGPRGRVLYRVVPGAPETIEPGLPKVPRLTYRLPDDLSADPVRIGGEGAVVLAGEFVQRKDHDGDRTCGVVFVSGSGGQDRYGFVPGTAIDTGSHAITDALARAGCVVLRFDDRGTGESERGPARIGYLDEVDDARRAVRALVSHPRVDPRRVVLVGHSLGGLTVMLLARERFAGRRPAAVVLISTAGRNLRRVIEDQIRWQYRDDPDRREKMLEETRQVHDAIVSGGPVPAATAPVERWLREVFAIDPVKTLRAVRAPVCVLQGDKDFQVHPVRDFDPLRAVVEAPTPPHGRAMKLPGLDHLMKPEPGDSSVGHYADLSRTVAPEAIEAIRTCLREEARVLTAG